MLQLENESLLVTCKLQGAELTRIYSKETKLEYLWDGDSQFWGRHAPILFPIVGQVKEMTYKVEGNSFHLPQHGFARDLDFTVFEHEGDRIVFRLMSSKDTLEIYPFHFTLEITYSLEASSVKTSYRVVNHSEEEMLFSIGGHPAFNCPLVKEGSFDDYYLEFTDKETPIQHHLNPKTGLRTGKVSTESLDSMMALNYDLFKNDAVIFEGLVSKSLAMKSSKHSHGLNFTFSNWKYLAFWTKKEGTPFLCIEPWRGITDKDDSNQIYEEKLGVERLKSGSEFEIDYVVEFF